MKTIILLYFACNFLQRHLKDFLRLFHRDEIRMPKSSYSVNSGYQRRGILLCCSVDQAEQTLYNICGRYLQISSQVNQLFTWYVKQDRSTARYKNKSCHLWNDYYVQYTMLSTEHFVVYPNNNHFTR